MKSIKYLRMALMALAVSLSASSCMDDDWKAPAGDTPAYGNNQLEEKNVISIQQLKDTYGALQKDQVNDTVRIAEGTQIRGIVTGNDIEGNLYNQITVDDGTAGIIICVAQGGMFGQVAVGQEILVDLGNLYYGTYRTQPQVGVAYHNVEKDQNYPSRMNRNEWQERFKAIGKPDPAKVQPIVIDNVDDLKNETTAYKLAGRLVTVKNVEFDKADGTTTYAPESEGYSTGFGVTRYFKNCTMQKQQVGVRTSCYADFAAEKLPQGKLNVTGILSCYKSSLTSSYGNTVQFALRQASDVQKVAE